MFDKEFDDATNGYLLVVGEAGEPVSELIGAFYVPRHDLIMPLGELCVKCYSPVAGSAPHGRRSPVSEPPFGLGRWTWPLPSGFHQRPLQRSRAHDGGHLDPSRSSTGSAHDGIREGAGVRDSRPT